ncbi:hypothetical protein E6C70_12945 [Glaciibacter flavus]|uniref:Uncharacterized protein n=1 Tax=Orlajensenia flava TaxID=2565934 RepID=A0A4S4FPY2_9MICO|nr:hypothetical protein [Glaciibacter flavus]THG32643.1 hypothetical protein E6C70_12945 [Glaciibacter flavus]
MDEDDVTELSLFAGGVYLVELSSGRHVSDKRRVPLRASVDEKTGEVRLFVDPESLSRLQDR